MENILCYKGLVEAAPLACQKKKKKKEKILSWAESSLWTPPERVGVPDTREVINPVEKARARVCVRTTKWSLTFQGGFTVLNKKGN